MQIESFPFSRTKSFSKLFLDYISGSVSLQPFVSVFPEITSIEKLTTQIETRNFDRNTLSTVIRKQYEKASILDEKTLKLIESLKEKNTYTVTTGHQLQLAGGPLFFTFKILTTIRLAEELNKKGDKKFIPIFWLASEDHDIEEINNISLFDKEFKWSPDIDGTPVSGSLSTGGLQEFFSQVFELLRGSRYETELKKLLTSSYLDSCSRNLSVATTRFVSQLFKDFPLLVIDSNDPSLKRMFVDVLHKETETGFSYEEAKTTTSQLEQAGYSGQASIRELNLFYINESNRERIDKDGRTFRTLTGSKEWDKDSIQTEIEEHPERFSPNVILRPVYQQVILPNVAYIGGPAEVAYWLQLKGVFEKAGAVFPAVVHRNSAMIVEKKMLDKIEKTGVAIEDLFTQEEELVTSFVKKHASQIDLSNEKEKVSEHFQSVIMKAEKTDPTLKPAAEAELKRIIHSMDAFEHKLLRAEKHKQEQSVNQLRKAKQKLFPGNGLMERQETILPYYMKFGPGFIHELYKAMEPVPASFKLLITEEA